MKKLVASAMVSAALLGVGIVAPGIAGADEDDNIQAGSAVVAEQADDMRPDKPTPDGEGPGLDRRHGPRGHDHHHARRLVADVANELLGIEGQELRQELQSGKSLAEVAEANGVSSDELVSAIVAEINERTDEAVEAGRVDADKAAERLANAEERVAELITKTVDDLPERGQDGERGGHRRGHRQGHDGNQKGQGGDS